MAASPEKVAPDGASEHTATDSVQDSVQDSVATPSTPKGSIRSGKNGPAGGPRVEFNLPQTPSKNSPGKREPPFTPRLKKKVPWKGKNIMILLPRDDERGRPGKAPKPMSESAATGMMRDWSELGYDIAGFDLDGSSASYAGLESLSMSRGVWPSFEDVARERSNKYQVTLPDLNAWKKYVDELNEAKLRALGVSFGDEDPPPPSISPAASSLPSRQASATQYPPLPFSPPIPTSSASSHHATQQFPFPAQFVPGLGSSAAQSPGIPSTASPGPFNPKLVRQSISIPAGAFQMPQQQPSPLSYSPQAMLLPQGIARGGSPALAHLNQLISPVSPFSPDGIQAPMHQRHQSLQYPMLPHQQQFQAAARASPRLQEVQEVDEPGSKSASKTPEPGPFIRHNASASLQKEIDDAENHLQKEDNDAEYHLEEQLRSQLDTDKDYSPHGANENPELPGANKAPHAREPYVQFAPQLQRFHDDTSSGPVLHHPRPHSRGHSLAKNYFGEPGEVQDSTDEGSFGKQQQAGDTSARKADESYEIETNPSNLGTPIQPQEFSKPLQHQRSFSTTSNPWSEGGSFSGASGVPRRPSHGSKASISKLNVEAPEFKFNPKSTFQPGGFVFGINSFQPSTFMAGMTSNAPPSVNSSQVSLPTTASSKINVNAPIFSPGQSEFSFSATGPKFRPDAPAFTPFHTLSDSVTSPLQSGSESIGNRGSSIFGNIDLNKTDVVKPQKKSKAIPIVKPASQRNTPEEEEPADDARQFDEEGRFTGDTRVKRAKASRDDGNDKPLFAEPSSGPGIGLGVSSPPTIPEAGESVDQRLEDDDAVLPEDTTMSSTIVSESTEAKATTSPSETSPQQGQMNWSPFEFKSHGDIADFNTARPFGDDAFSFRKHKKSLSATAKPFVPGMSADATTTDDSDEAMAEAEDPTLQSVEEPDADLRSPSPMVASPTQEQSPSRFTSSPTPVLKGLSASRYAASPSPPPLPAKPLGLAASRYASSPPLMPEPIEPIDEEGQLITPEDTTQESLQQPETLPLEHEPSFEEIDDIMRHLNENDPAKGVNKTVEAPQWHQPSPTRHIDLAAVTNTSPLHLAPQNQFRSDAPSPSPRQFRLFPSEAQPPLLSTELEDPFLDPPQTLRAPEGVGHRANGSESLPASDWDGAFTDDEQAKLESRVNFFDGHVNDVVGGLLSARLGPVEKSLQGIQHALSSMSRRTPSSRRDRRSMSAEVQSDADDEDDEAPRRSMSPRRDRRMEQMRVVVLEALAAQQRNAPPPQPLSPAAPSQDNSSILKALEEMKEQFGQSLHLDFRGEDLRNIVEDAVERRMPPTPQPVVVPGQEELSNKYNDLQARFAELEQRLRLEEGKVEAELTARRTADDRTAELHRKLEMAETKIEVEIMNRSAFDQRVADLEDRLKHQEESTEEELKGRRAAEDRLAEVQRLLRIASEEETRLREDLEERDQKIKSSDDTRGKSTMRLALLEAAQANNQKTHSDLQNKVNTLEVDLRDKSHEARHWRLEAERAIDLSQRQGDDLVGTTTENKHLKKVIDTLGTQLEENERVREGWRSKFLSLQDDMSRAAREIAEENAHRIKNEQNLIARHEVLDARLQAEAKTRERLESELERLEGGERQGMRAVNECKRLESLLGELRTENHQLHQSSMKYQAEFEQARESGAREVQRTREALQGEVEQANHEVNVIREAFEDQLSRLRAQLDQVKLDADTAKAQHEMMLEEAQSSKRAELDEVARQQDNDMEDLQARFERQINNTTEDAQRAEQNLLERLSISASKSEHLQDRVHHLEEKLEIAKEAALAAAKAAKSPMSPASPERGLQAAAPLQAKAIPKHMELPEKISPQALRESIMVLQEQLQQREQHIEELEQALARMDPDADTKIAKRDDEIMWLRELLAVRHSDLQDIITALDRDDVDMSRVKNACIRLKANLQMEEQERERAMSGASALNLPNMAASIRDAATPRVAQAVGPLAAAWGNWRKSRDPSAFGSLSGVLSSPSAAGTPASAARRRNAPARANPAAAAAAAGAQSSFLSGLLTPPQQAGGGRQTPPLQHQPTAFASTGRRFTAEQLGRAPQGSGPSGDKAGGGREPLRRMSRGPPVTPPMMRSSTYDSDAHVEEFDDAGFFDD